MLSIATWTRQHRVVAFFGAAFVLSWWAWPLYALDLSRGPDQQVAPRSAISGPPPGQTEPVMS